VTALLLLVALVAQAPQTPDVFLSVRHDDHLIVTVKPRDDRRVATLRVEPQPTKTPKAAAPRQPLSRLTLPKGQGERFTFTPIAEPYDIVITFTDQSTYRLEQKTPGPYTVRPSIIAR